VSTLAPAPGGALSPLRHPVFRALWIAQFASNLGTWMHLVGAQWLMTGLDPSPLAVSLVQTATTLPVLLIGLPAGALGDVVDRRRLLIITQFLMLASAALLALLTGAGLVTAGLLLLITFLLGAGQAATLPAWQAIQPELVPLAEIPRAAALNGVNMNLARAVGPALGGLIVAAAGAAWVFALNALSFLGILVVLGLWHRETPARPIAPERLGGALRTGLRYVRSAPRLRALLVRAMVFVVGSSALWALLPLVARDRLGLGSGGYGVLLGAMGAGAVLGALVLPRVRARLGLNLLVVAGSVVFGLVTVVSGVVTNAAVVAVALAIGGGAWLSVLASANGSAQQILPSWVRARGMGAYLLVVQGGLAGGSVLWGAVAQAAGLRWTLVAAGAALVLTVPLARPFPVGGYRPPDLTPSRHWHDPELLTEPDPDHGPVLVTIEYRVPAECRARFVDHMTVLGRARRRSGARRWGLWQDGHDHARFVETFSLRSWEEHLRQHLERGTASDREREARVRELLEPGTRPVVHHLLGSAGTPAVGDPPTPEG
jgi:MFS family permease